MLKMIKELEAQIRDNKDNPPVVRSLRMRLRAIENNHKGFIKAAKKKDVRVVRNPDKRTGMFHKGSVQLSPNVSRNYGRVTAR